MNNFMTPHPFTQALMPALEQMFSYLAQTEIQDDMERRHITSESVLRLALKGYKQGTVSKSFLDGVLRSYTSQPGNQQVTIHQLERLLEGR